MSSLQHRPVHRPVPPSRGWPPPSAARHRERRQREQQRCSSPTCPKFDALARGEVRARSMSATLPSPRHRAWSPGPAPSWQPDGMSRPTMPGRSRGRWPGRGSSLRPQPTLRGPTLRRPRPSSGNSVARSGRNWGDEAVVLDPLKCPGSNLPVGAAPGQVMRPAGPAIRQPPLPSAGRARSPDRSRCPPSVLWCRPTPTTRPSSSTTIRSASTDGRHPLRATITTVASAVSWASAAPQRRVGGVVEGGEGVVEEVDLRALAPAPGRWRAAGADRPRRWCRPARSAASSPALQRRRRSRLACADLQRVPELLVGGVGIAVAQVAARPSRRRGTASAAPGRRVWPACAGSTVAHVHAVDQHLAARWRRTAAGPGPAASTCRCRSSR